MLLRGVYFNGYRGWYHLYREILYRFHIMLSHIT